jgi:RNA recognition motif-containing protein
MINIFIANLDFDITSDDLRTTFSQFGEVSYAHVVYDRQTKESKGYGYIEMESPEEARNAISTLNGLEIQGRKIDVKEALPKGKRPEKNEDKPLKLERKKPSGREFTQPKVVKDAEVTERRVLRPRRKKKD